MGELILLGLVIGLEPLPILGFILVLSTDHGIRNGAAFIVGWVGCLALVIAGTLLATGGTPVEHGSPPALLAGVVKVLVGAGLLLYAVHLHRNPGAVPHPEPGWASRLDRIGVVGAASVGVLLQPWALVAAGAAVVVGADLAKPASLVVLVLFMVLATAPTAGMEIYAATAPERAAVGLESIRSWIDTHRDRGIVILSTVVGVWLVANGVYLLATQ